MEVNNENSLIPWILLLVVLQHSSLVERQKRSEKAVAEKIRIMVLSVEK